VAADKIRGDYAELDRIGQIFGGQAEQVAGMAKNLEKCVDVLRGGDWVGHGASAFYAEMNGQVMPSLLRLARALTQAQSATALIRAGIQGAEAEAARVLNALPGNASAVNAAGAKPRLLSGGTPGGANGVASFARNPSFDDVNANNGPYRTVPGEVSVDDAGQVSPNGISPNDVTQGNLGDCYVLSSLAAVATQNPDLIRNMIRANPDGTYTVTFKKQNSFGVWYDSPVTVDGKFPVELSYLEAWQEGIDKGLGKPDWDLSKRLPYAKPGDYAGGKPELWVAIIEKAYAKQGGGYDKIGGGGFTENVLPMITGQRSIGHDPQKMSLHELSESFKNGSAITVETHKPWPWYLTQVDSVGGNGLFNKGVLTPSHGFYVVGVDEANGTVIVKNPWGWGKNPTQAIPYSELQKASQNIVTNDGTRRK